MTSFPRSPRLLKGVIVSLDPLMGFVPNVIVLQYNPDSLTRTLQPQASSGQGSRSEAFRLSGPPVETIKLDAEIDATDQLEQPDSNPITVGLGIHPTLAALEMLLYPKSALVIVNAALALAGTIEVVPPEAPLTLFVWGPARVLPVRLTDFSITEEAFDTQLNPTRAKVSLGLRVLNYNDLAFGTPGYALFMVHQVAKEVMAATNLIGSAQAAASFSFSL